VTRDPIVSTEQRHPELKALLDSFRGLSDSIHRQQSDLPSTLWSELEAVLPRMHEAVERLQREWLAQQREQEELRALVQVSQAVNSTLDLATVLNEVMDHIIELTGAERAFLMLINEVGELEFKVARNLDRETIAGSSFDISRTIAYTVAREGQPVVTTNAQADPRFSSQESVIGYNLRSILCVPLRVREKITGVIYADNRIRAGLFGDRDRDLLAALANQAALAIENARLFEQVKSQLEQITEMKALMDNVFASIPSGVISTDVADKITLFNRAAETILAVPTYRAIHQLYRVVLPMKERLGSLVEDVKRKDRPAVAYEDVLLPSRGQVNLSLSIAPLKDAENLTMGVAIVVDDLTEKKKMEAKREVFRRMVSPAVFDSLPDNPEELRLGGVRREITVFFADIRNFTSYAEKLDPERLIEVLNQYLKIGADAVLAEDGTLDKFIGDQIMGIFNAPNDLPDHTFHAVCAGLTMQKAIAAYYHNVPESERLSFGVGINFGTGIVGYIGTQQKSDYTAVGDVVNYGKRLQENARGGQVLLSRAAYECVRERVVANALEPIQVKGRTAMEPVYEVLALK
jgi:class 3 adenylate cyclase